MSKEEAIELEATVVELIASSMLELWLIDMSLPPATSPELTSWKEIATFLGVSVRTAQKWEAERGLPVRRLPGGRSHVSARIEDLAAWRDD